LTEAALFYVAESPQAAARFDETIERAMVDIAEHPQAYPRLPNGVQYKVLDRFPFTIYFVIRGELAEIFSVAHHRLPPPGWRGYT
jgi:plasmid stabilization system protein ParE